MKRHTSTVTPYLKRAVRDGSLMRGSEGFSLVEVLVAIMIFSIGLLGMAAMQTNAMGTNKSANKISNATEKSVAVIEELLSLPYTHASLANGVQTPDKENDWIDNDDNGVVDEAGETGDFTVEWTVVDDEMITDTKRVTVTVTSDVSKKKVTVASLISLKE